MREQFRLLKEVGKYARSWRGAPSTSLRRDGYSLASALLTPDDCVRLSNLALSLARANPTSRLLEGGSYIVHRADGPREYDREVVQIMNAQELDATLAAIFNSGVVERQFQQQLGDVGAVKLRSITLQIDRSDSVTKRGYHVDAHAPVVYKSFTYLTPVIADDDGPYTVVPGSHRHFLRKIFNILATQIGNRPITDTPLYRDSRSVRLKGGPGTTILSIQSIAHKGWMPQVSPERVVMIAYLDTRAVVDEPFTLGREIAVASGSRLGSA
jgi:hypothetical protein